MLGDCYRYRHPSFLEDTRHAFWSHLAQRVDLMLTVLGDKCSVLPCLTRSMEDTWTNRFVHVCGESCGSDVRVHRRRRRRWSVSLPLNQRINLAERLHRLLKEPARFIEVKDVAKNAGVAWQILHGVTLFGGTVTLLYTSSRLELFTPNNMADEHSWYSFQQICCSSRLSDSWHCCDDLGQHRGNGIWHCQHQRGHRNLSK